MRPVARRRFVSRDVAIAAFARSAPIDPERFRADLDRRADQDPTLRG